MKDYNHAEIEARWQDIWNKAGTYEPDLKEAKKPFYNLMMFPYPSGEGLHVGHAFAFSGADIYGRFRRMHGADVFQPIGFDSFGIHSENYALIIGKHPRNLVAKTTARYEAQLKSLGIGFSWKQKLSTSDIDYYRWTQWVFVKLFKAGLAYRAKALVNWCPNCKTVLADEQVVGKQLTVNSEQLTNYVCERCGNTVKKKGLTQWFFRITAYANRLLDNLEKLDWSDKIVVAQRNWIGKSKGVKLLFQIDIEKTYSVAVFTTRPDTIYGVTYLALAPAHPLVTTILENTKGLNRQQIRDFVDNSLKEGLGFRDKGKDDEAKNGIFSGLYATNPINGNKIPVYIANYVLMDYGSGAVMGVPAHDERDWEFAKKYGIEILQVIEPTGPVSLSALALGHSFSRDQRLDETGPVRTFPPTNARSNQKPIVGQKDNVELRVGESPSSSATRFSHDVSRRAFTEYGILINSGVYSGLTSQEAILKITKDLEKKKIGQEETTWHLRDWIISRQRYWGPPIPMIFCQACAGQRRSWFTRNMGPVSGSSHSTSSTKQKPNVHQKDDQSLRALGGTPSAATTHDTEISNLKFKIKNSMQSMAGWYPVAEEDLPVELPYMENFKPTGTSVSPLGQNEDFVNIKCPGCGAWAKRETDVSDTFLDSAWYFLRYPSVEISNFKFQILNKNEKLKIKNSKADLPWDTEITKRWLPVDMYIGGAEHAVLHLLYSRFVTMVFYDLGLIDFSTKGGLTDEPFPKFRAHGLVIKDGAKMSKSRGNVVVPDDYIAKFGADTLRCYLMFCGRYSDGGDFRDDGIEGMHRFLRRVWRLVQENSKLETRNSKLEPEALYMLHKTIKKVTEDIENLDYNTAIAALMEWMNFLEEKVVHSSQLMVNSKKKNKINEPQTTNYELLTKEEVSTLLLLLAPFAPHMTEELWQLVNSSSLIVDSKKNTLNHEPRTMNHQPNYQSIHLEKWPEFDEKLAVSQKVTVIIQVNGKLRDKIELERGIAKEEVLKMARELQNIAKYLSAGKVVAEIYVPDKLVNFVVKQVN